LIRQRELGGIINLKRTLDCVVTADSLRNFQNDSSCDKFELTNFGIHAAMENGIRYGRYGVTWRELLKILRFTKPNYNLTTRQPEQEFKSKSLSKWIMEVESVTSKSEWTGGTESQTFNRLENIVMEWEPQTPVLGCRISRVLESKVVGKDYLPSRINWVIQSSAVDYLHLFLVSARWFMEELGVKGRFVISIHDEIRYLVHEEDKYAAALALQYANLCARAMFYSRLGMTNMPESVAFLSSVDVDKVMRKDPTAECFTPSNPEGLTKGHGIPSGECLTMEDILEKVKESENPENSALNSRISEGYMDKLLKYFGYQK